SGGIVNGDINTDTIPVVGNGLSLLGLDATLNSTAQIAGDFGTLAATGTTTIQKLNLDIAGIPVDLSAFVGVNVAPNTSVNLAVLGIANASLILNEQNIGVGSSSISVNAFHLSLNLANISGQVILGHSQASMVATAVPEPSSTALIATACLPVLASLVVR